MSHPFTLNMPIQWGQTNVFEQVSEALILQWVETGRVELLEELDLLTFDGEKPGIILGKTVLTQHHPTLYPDSVRIETSVAEILDDRFILQTEIFSLTHDRLLSSNLATLVLYDYREELKMKIPLSLRERLEGFLVDQ